MVNDILIIMAAVDSPNVEILNPEQIRQRAFNGLYNGRSFPLELISYLPLLGTSFGNMYRRYQSAIEWRKSLPSDGPTLIFCAAYHPLYANGEPGILFQRCLDTALEVGERIDGDVHYFVSGSRHANDKKSLSQSGHQYWMRQKGRAAKPFIHGPNWMDKYMGRAGVYNTFDEVQNVALAIKNEEILKNITRFIYIAGSPWIDRILTACLFHRILPHEIYSVPHDISHQEKVIEGFITRSANLAFPLTSLVVGNLSRRQRKPKS